MKPLLYVSLLLAPPASPENDDHTTIGPSLVAPAAPAGVPSPAPSPETEDGDEVPCCYTALSMNRAELKPGARWPPEARTTDLYWGIGISHARPLAATYALSAIFGVTHMPLSWFGLSAESGILTHPQDYRSAAGIFSFGPTIRFPSAFRTRSGGFEHRYIMSSRDDRTIFRNGAAFLTGSFDVIAGHRIPHEVGAHITLGGIFYPSRGSLVGFGCRFGRVWDVVPPSDAVLYYFGASFMVGFTIGRAAPQTRTDIMYDRDRDGVPDAHDRCPRVSGMDGGCPADADGDGVVDIADRCMWDPYDRCGYPNPSVSSLITIDLGCVGGKGCMCIDHDCDEGLECAFGRCVIESEECPRGARGCECRESDSRCDETLICNETFGGAGRCESNGDEVVAVEPESVRVQRPEISNIEDLKNALAGNTPVKVFYFDDGETNMWTEDFMYDKDYAFTWELLKHWAPNTDACYLVTGHADEKRPQLRERSNCDYAKERALTITTNLFDGHTKFKRISGCDFWAPGPDTTPKARKGKRSEDEQWYKRRVEIHEVDCEIFGAVMVSD